MDKQYVDIRGLADMMCMSAKTIRGYRSARPDRLPPACNKKGRPLWKVETVEAWIEGRLGDGGKNESNCRA